MVKAKPAKVGPYQQVNVTGDGFNARESFKQYLQKNGLADLIHQSTGRVSYGYCVKDTSVANLCVLHRSVNSKIERSNFSLP